ncbi:hypothetical protein IPdc08_00022 [archaeon]|nr:hypothetical protein IPdc08_00022 [archaeon]
MSNRLASSQRYPIRYFENIDRKAKRINKFVLTIPNQGVKVDKENIQIRIPSLKLKLGYDSGTILRRSTKLKSTRNMPSYQYLFLNPNNMKQTTILRLT